MTIRVLILVFVCLFTLTACMTPTSVADQATQYNLSLEKNNNEVLLLNIIRASQRRPLYFSSLAKFNGMVNSFSGGLSIPFGPGSTSGYTFTPNVGLNPNFDVVPLDTQEFTRGFLQPVDINTVEYYWRTGWPKSLLLTLMVGGIETKEGERIFENYPPNPQQYNCFKDHLNFLLSSDSTNGGSLILKSENSVEAVGPALEPSKVADIKTLMSVAKDQSFSLQYDEKNNKYQMYKNDHHFVLCKQNKCADKNDRPANKNTALISRSGNDPKMKSACKSSNPSQHADADIADADIVLRSPESIIYFLGEVVRTELEKENDAPTVEICSGKPVKLFYVREATKEDTNPYLSVTYDGKRYVVPREGESFKDNLNSCEIPRTMHVLSLVSQLIGLQKVGKDLPTTSTVRISGQ